MFETMSKLFVAWWPDVRPVLNFLIDASLPLIGAWLFSNWLIDYLSGRDDA